MRHLNGLHCLLRRVGRQPSALWCQWQHKGLPRVDAVDSDAVAANESVCHSGVNPVFVRAAFTHRARALQLEWLGCTVVSKQVVREVAIAVAHKDPQLSVGAISKHLQGMDGVSISKGSQVHTACGVD